MMFSISDRRPTRTVQCKLHLPWTMRMSVMADWWMLSMCRRILPDLKSSRATDLSLPPAATISVLKSSVVILPVLWTWTFHTTRALARHSRDTDPSARPHTTVTPSDLRLVRHKSRLTIKISDISTLNVSLSILDLSLSGHELSPVMGHQSADPGSVEIQREVFLPDRRDI